MHGVTMKYTLLCLTTLPTPYVTHTTVMPQLKLKKIFNTNPDGVRRVGRPKLRWEDGVDKDTRILWVKNWKRVALNRDEWAKLPKKARARQGLSTQ